MKKTKEVPYKVVMKASHRITHAMRILGLMEYPADSICQTCGDKRKLVAHHWNGNENPLDVWYVCYRCNKILPNGGIALEEAKRICNEPTHYELHITIGFFEMWAQEYFDTGELWMKDEALEIYSGLSRQARANIACSGRLDSSRLSGLLTAGGVLPAKVSV